MDSPWQPIKTAPKDGTRIVYFDDDPSVSWCSWDDEQSEWWDEDRDQICHPVLWVTAPLNSDRLK